MALLPELPPTPVEPPPSLAEMQRLVQELQAQKRELEREKQELVSWRREAEAELFHHRTLCRAMDVSERKQAEEMSYFQAQLLAGVEQSVIATDLSGHITYFNPAAEAQFGWAFSEVVGRNIVEVMASTATQAQGAEIMQQLARGESWTGEFGCRRRDGTNFVVQVTDSPIRNVAGELVGIKGVSQDITQRKQTAEALRRTRELLERAFDALSAGVVIYRADGSFDECNAAAERILGLSADQIAGHTSVSPPWETVHADGRPMPAESLPAMMTLRTGQPLRDVVMGVRRPSGQHTWLSVSSMPLSGEGGALCSFTDITHRKSLETQLRQAQKLEVIGRLAGGIAHDFNNILQAMMLNLELLQLESRQPAEPRGPLDDLKELTERAATVTSQLLMFARQKAVQLRTVDLNAALNQLVSLLRRLLGEHIVITVEFGGPPLFVEADAGMLDQIIMNLCLNARDSMPDGGRLTLATELVEWSAETAARHSEARPGTFVCLGVSDTGCGMSAELLEHIFEPFFTTKEAGRGTGLGLAAVYGLVKQHLGFVQVDSALGKGSRFRLYLPWSAKVAYPQRSQPESRPKASATQTVLLVEDEEMLRKVGVQMLQRQGYRVIGAADGPDALRLWELHHEAIDLLISDMVMPGGLTGLQLAEQLRARKPQLQVILASGYSEEIIKQSAKSPASIAFLAKPFRFKELLELVQELLEY
jgi:PAS domain S-box-containing protein